MTAAVARCLVTVDLTTTPPTTTPKNLGSLSFNDPSVGMSNTQMAVFKGNLAELLPDIAADIAQIPESASLNIGELANFVRLSLLAAQGPYASSHGPDPLADAGPHTGAANVRALPAAGSAQICFLRVAFLRDGKEQTTTTDVCARGRRGPCVQSEVLRPERVRVLPPQEGDRG